MSRRFTPVSLRDESGFTLVELLVAMTIGLLILAATLAAFIAFNRGVATNSSVNDAEDNGRRDVSNMVTILRDAGAPSPVSGNSVTAVARASVNDIVFLSTAWPGQSATGSTGTSVERLCLDTATKTVWFDGLKAGVTGPSDPGLSCPSTASGWTHRPMSTNVSNSASSPLFRLGSTTPVRSIGIQLVKNDSTSESTGSLSLYSGGTMRGALAPQVSSGDVTVTCGADGSSTAPKALLSLGAATAPGLNLAASGAITAGPGQILVGITGHATTTVALTVTNALGLQTLLFKDVTC